MNRRFKVLIFLLLIIGQIILQRYVQQLKIHLDLLYLILVYISVMSGFYKTLLTASLIGLVTDYFCSANLMGVFGFSRVIAGFILNEVSHRIDLKNNIFVFLLIAVSLSFSNAIANLFLYFIQGFSFNLDMLLYQPVLTGLLGLIIVTSSKARMYLDVY